MRRLLVLCGFLWLTLGCSFSGCGSGVDCEDLDEDGWQDCGGWSGNTEDCDDHDPSQFPGADERCNGQDDDCNGEVDDDAYNATNWPRDADGDGYGGRGDSTTSCSQPAGYATNNDDCDDDDASSHPDATEICDGADNDCDDHIDEDAVDPPTWYRDGDGDGYGSLSSSSTCNAPPGYVVDNTDCDDTTADRAPGNPEVCATGVDEDCLDDTPDDCGYRTRDISAALLGSALGTHTNELAGAAVAAAGDIDDDGFDDLLVGGAGDGATPAGVYLVGGTVSGTTSLRDARTHLETSIEDDQAGFSVDGGQDVDADGHADILFGAPGVGIAGDLPGAAWLLYGPDVVGCSPFCDGASIVGDAVGDEFGAAVALVGDTDGDGLDDLLIGEPGRGGQGGAALFVNAPVGNLDTTAASARFAASDRGHAGAWVRGAGDVNDDGYADMALVDPTNAALWLVEGPFAGATALADAAVRVDVPVRDGALSSVVLDDLDGDGSVDVLATATRDAPQAGDLMGWGNLGPLAGGLAAGTDLTVSTRGLYANGGLRAVSLGDLNFDGAAELVFFAPAAAALLAPDYARLYETPPTLWSRPGPLTGPMRLDEGTIQFATSLDGLPVLGGDINGDLRPDLALGIPEDDSRAADAGGVQVFSGAALY